MLASLIAAVAIAQATPQQPAWHWGQLFGQRVELWGVKTPDGRIDYSRSDPFMVAPSEMERRRAEQQAVAPTDQPPPLNYGVVVDKLANDARVLRASDPETLRMVTEAAERRPRRPDPDSDPERKPSVIQRVENDVETIVCWVVAFALVAGAVFLIVRVSKPPQPPASVPA